MTEDRNRRYKLKEEIAYQEVGEEFILVQPVTQELHRTNDTGQKILEGIERELPLDEIADLLTEEFDVDRSRALQDVDRFVEALFEKDLIEEVEDNSEC